MNFEAKDLLRLPGEGEMTDAHMVIKATTADMEGDFSVMEGLIEQDTLIAPHKHDNEAQLVYVITGELEFEVGGKGGLRFTAPAGSYIIKPRGVLHAFWNKKETPARYIELSGKEHFEGFVRSNSKGTLYAYAHSKDYGVHFVMKESLRLLREHKLTGLSGMEFPGLPALPDWFKDLLPKKK